MNYSVHIWGKSLEGESLLHTKTRKSGRTRATPVACRLTPRLTTACRRRLPASARASLPLSAAPDAQRSAPRGGCGVAGERWERSAPSTVGGRGGGRHARGVSVVSCDHHAPWHGGRVWGVPLPRARTPLCASVPCGRPLGLLPCATGVRGAWHADRGRSCGHRTVSPAASAAGVAWGGDPGGSGASWPSLAAVPGAAAGVSR